MNIINATAHTITFSRDAQNPEAGTYQVPPCGIVISARPVDEVVRTANGVTFVRTTFGADESNEEALSGLEQNGEPLETVIVGSIIAAQAFPGRIMAMIPAPGYERVPTELKRMRADRFTTFEAAGTVDALLDRLPPGDQDHFLKAISQAVQELGE